MNDILYSKWLKILVARSETVPGIEIPYLDPADPESNAILAGAERIDACSRRAAFEFLAHAPRLKVPLEALDAVATVTAEAGRIHADIAPAVVTAGMDLSGRIPAGEFARWSEAVIRVTGELPRAAVAVLRTSRQFYEYPRRISLNEWIEGGRKTWQLGWQTYGLLEMVLASAAEAASVLPPRSFQFWCDTAASLSHRVSGLAQDFCQEPLPRDLPVETEEARLELLAAVAASHPEQFAAFRRQLAETVRRAPGRLKVLAPVLARLVSRSADGCLNVVRKLAAASGEVADSRYGQVAGAARRILEKSPSAAMGLLESMDEVLRLVGPEEFARWVEEGERLLESSPGRAEAHFKLSSRSARASLQAYVRGVRFEEIARSLRLYAQGLTGREIPLVPLDWHRGKNLPTTDGEKIYLPALVYEHGGRDENRRVFRVMCAHQCGFFEFGTFGFSLEKMKGVRSGIVRVSDYAAGAPAGGSDLDRFFLQFPRTQLAKDLFLLLENFRIDEALLRNYPGLDPDIAWLRKSELEKRSIDWATSPASALVEVATQLSLGLETVFGHIPADDLTSGQMQFEEQFQNLRALFSELRRPEATVEHTAVRTAELYRLFSLFLDTRRAGVDMGAESRTDSETGTAGESVPEPGGQGGSEPAPPGSSGPEVPPDFPADYGRPEPVRFHGELNPDEIQRRVQARGALDIAQRLMGNIEMMRPEEIASWLGDGDELSFLPMGPDEEAGGRALFSSMFDMDRAREAVQHAPEALPEILQEFQQEVRRMARLDTLDERYDDAFRYDEWDHKLGDYRHAWCTVRERNVETGNPEFVDRALAENSNLISKVIRQFEAIRPELLKKETRLPDGEEIDLNTVIEGAADRRAGLPYPERIYSSRRRQERDVAAMFLIDMSASTGEKIPDEELSGPPPPSAGEPAGYFSDPRFGVAADGPPAAPAGAPRKTVLDLQKEALVVMSQALNYLGDDYAVLGFSGYGRERVDLYKIKEFGEPYSDRVKARIGGIRAQQSTRMGAAIRHAIEKLRGLEARYRTLVMLSDGYPQDSDYGEDRTDENYSLLDTRLALEEATRAGIHTFCITVDKAGYDYLKQMCPPDAYLVIDRIRDLPEMLPRVYRAITR